MLGNRAGRPSNAALKIPDNYPEFPAGTETRQIAAEKSGFGSEFTYRQAKAVVDNGAPELVAAVAPNFFS